MPRVHHVKKARKDHRDIKKGESYYWWKFRYGGRRTSRIRPTRQQLTQSGFLQNVYDIEDSIGAITTDEDMADQIQQLVDDVQSLSDETQESLDAMPEQLQENSDSGMLLQERIESLEEMVSELESIDVDVDDDLKDDEKQERYEQIIEEIQNISYQGG